MSVVIDISFLCFFFHCEHIMLFLIISWDISVSFFFNDISCIGRILDHRDRLIRVENSRNEQRSFIKKRDDKYTRKSWKRLFPFYISVRDRLPVATWPWFPTPEISCFRPCCPRSGSSTWRGSSTDIWSDTEICSGWFQFNEVPKFHILLGNRIFLRVLKTNKLKVLIRSNQH